MDSQPTLETVVQALNALYHNPDASGKEKASLWLGELQKSVYAWHISDQLLQLNQDVESCYFAAQTMRTKIQYAFHELPPGSHDNLRDSLLNHVTKVTPQTPPAIATQLCLAVADLALQMATWKNAASDIIQKFGANNHHWHFLVELLTVLPEEINSRSLRLGTNRRNDITGELEKTSAPLVQLLTNVLASGGDDTRLQSKVLKCLGSWFSVHAMPQDVIMASTLLQAPFHALASPQCASHLHEAASDCICWALYSAEDIEKNMRLAQAMFQGVVSLQEAYHMSVAMEDVDKSINYCRVFTEMAESFLEMIVSQPNQGFGDLRTLELLLICIGHHQYEVPDITFNFWYRLSEILYQKNNDEINQLFKPYISRLIVALCRHCQFDSDQDGIPSSGDEFSDFRHRVSELVKDVVFIVGSSSIFGQMFEQLRTQSSTASWETSEAALFVMTAVARNILPEEDGVVPQVFAAVLSLPPHTHVMMRYTAIQMTGELCEWIEKHPHNLDPVLQFLLAGLQDAQLATVAANALRKVCEQCSTQMTEHFTGLLHIVQAMDSFNVSHEASLGLLRGAALILARMPNDKVTAGLQQLCNIQVAPLNKILEQTVKADEKKPDPSKFLDRLATIFRDTNPTVTNGQVHPCQPVIQEVWPVLSNTCNKYCADVKIIERCCRCIRYAVRCLHKNSAVLLTPLVTQMVALYQNYPHSCFLYLGSILVDEYGTEPGCLHGLLEMLQAFGAPSFKLLEEQNGLRNHPDTIDDLFRLALRFTQRTPVPFLQSPMIKPLLCCGIATLSLDHRDANASVTKFLAEFTKTGRKRDKEDVGPECEQRRALALQLLGEHGQAMTTGVVSACIHTLPTYMMTDSAEVLYEMLCTDKTSTLKWLEETLKSLPTQSSGGAVTATPQQLTDFHKLISSADDLKKVSRGIREFSRLWNAVRM